MKKSSLKHKILYALIPLLVLMGCGLKSNPVPSASGGTGHSIDLALQARFDGKAVGLTWRLPDQTEGITRLMIKKTRPGSLANDCTDCPRVFEKIGEMTVDERKIKEGSYPDPNVEKGKMYGYQITICRESGVCYESQTVEVNCK